MLSLLHFTGQLSVPIRSGGFYPILEQSSNDVNATLIFYRSHVLMNVVLITDVLAMQSLSMSKQSLVMRHLFSQAILYDIA